MFPSQVNIPKRGLSLIEVVVAVSIFSIAILAVMSALISITRLENANHDELMAINVARQKFAELQAAPFQSVLAFYGPTSSVNKFKVAQLEGGTGQFIFPINTNGKLDETIVDENMGMPQDLNGNRSASETNVSASYTVLPVRVQLQWDSTTGRRELKLTTMLTKLK